MFFAGGSSKKAVYKGKVVGQAQERRFPFDLHTSPEQEPAEVHILLCFRCSWSDGFTYSLAPESVSK